jgi:hypothetical protein
MNNTERWHALFDKGDIKALEELLAKDVVFYSPLVFKPKPGRKLAAIYLENAYRMFFSDGNKSFSYVNEIHSSTDSMLEFTCEIDGIMINGIDLIKWNEQGKIQEFKVFIRPNKAIEKVKQKMSELLSDMSTFDQLKLKASIIADKWKK